MRRAGLFLFELFMGYTGILMSIRKNINKNLDTQFENHDYLPQPLFLEDLDAAAKQFFESLNLAIPDENQNNLPVPVIFLNQERWAEFRNNWKHLRDEGGKEITMPFMTLGRTGVKKGESPLKRTTIPAKRLFPFLKVPVVTDGRLRGYDIWKVPQPVRVDVTYELRFFSHYIQHANKSYEKMIYKAFSDGQAYIKVNGYDVYIDMGEPSEDNSMADIAADRRFQIVYPVTLHGKLVDPADFEKVKTITKINLDIKEF